MPKLLFLTCWYPTSENPAAGIFVKEHARAVRFCGADITVIHLNVKKGNRFLKTYHVAGEIDGIPTIVLNIESMLWKWVFQIPWLLWLIVRFSLKKLDFVALSEIELVHSHVIFPAGIIGHKLSLSLGVPHIISEHWSKTRSFFKSSPFSFAAKSAYNSAAAVLPVSPWLERVIRTYCSHLKLVKVVPNIIDTGIFSFKEKPQINKVVFCAAGQWQKQRNYVKRPDLFIEALGRLKGKTDKNIELLIAGGGNLRDNLQEKCNRLGIQTEFVGFLSKKEIAAMMQESAIFLHASDFETFGIVVYEALATGTPVIASRLEVFEGLINDTNGILCENTVDDWEKGIDLAMQREYNHRGISESFQEKYSYRAVGELLLHIYKKILPG